MANFSAVMSGNDEKSTTLGNRPSSRIFFMVGQPLHTLVRADRCHDLESRRVVVQHLPTGKLAAPSRPSFVPARKVATGTPSLPASPGLGRTP